MRLYSFTNYYMSPLQLGLQTAHLVADMFAHHSCGNVLTDRLHEWAVHHKTIIILNGGNSANITDIYQQLQRVNTSLCLPMGIFQEDMESLNGAVTVTGIVVPSKIYEYASSPLFSVMEPEIDLADVSQAEHDLAVILRSCPLAR